MTTIIITMGDPKGISPEIIIKALTSEVIGNFFPDFKFLIIGSSDALSRAAQALKVKFEPVKLVRPVLTDKEDGNIFLFESATERESRNGLKYILSAIEIVQSQKGAPTGLPTESRPVRDVALVTAPVSKQSIQETDYSFVGHTELLAQKTLSRKVTMMFVAPQLKVSLVTRHIPYKKVLLYLTADRILSTIEQTEDGLRRYFGIAQPRIAVCGLNPHSGEGERFGKEEKTIIKPAIELAKRRKITCDGPFPADSIFHRASVGEFDAVIALYHDQGLIPIKTLAFTEAVQVTLGLPFIRTSPCHGVAFDIAGKGIANPSSMIESIKLAISMSRTERNETLLFS